MRFTKRVVGQGHVTVPQDLRSALSIDGGDLVEFEVVGVIRKAAVKETSPAPVGAPVTA